MYYLYSEKQNSISNMKVPHIIMLLGAMFLFASCATQSPGSDSSVAASSTSTSYGSVRKGMSMSQVQAVMGSPRSKVSSNGQTIWTYTDSNVWALRARSLAPYGIGLIGAESEVETTQVVFRGGYVSRVDRTSATKSANPWSY